MVRLVLGIPTTFASLGGFEIAAASMAVRQEEREEEEYGELGADWKDRNEPPPEAFSRQSHRWVSTLRKPSLHVHDPLDTPEAAQETALWGGEDPVLLLAEDVMAACGGRQQGGNFRLSLKELQSHLRGTPHQGFSEWLTGWGSLRWDSGGGVPIRGGAAAGVGGVGGLDGRDHSGELAGEEVASAVRAYITHDPNQRRGSAPRKSALAASGQGIATCFEDLLAHLIYVGGEEEGILADAYATAASQPQQACLHPHTCWHR